MQIYASASDRKRVGILWQTFQLFRRILNVVSSIIKVLSLRCWLQSTFLTKTDRCAGALSWRRNQMFVLHFSGRFLLTASRKRRRMSTYISLFTVENSVNYTSEFREFLKLIRAIIELLTLKKFCLLMLLQWLVEQVLALVRLLIHNIGNPLSIFILLYAFVILHNPFWWHASSNVHHPSSICLVHSTDQGH